MHKLDARAEANLKGVHPDLQRVVRRAITTVPNAFTITEGVRTMERQRRLVAAGASRTLNSRHLTGHAVDFAVKVNGVIRWDWPLYSEVAKHFKAAAKLENVPIVWGGDWKSFKDGPHVELDRRKYP